MVISLGVRVPGLTDCLARYLSGHVNLAAAVFIPLFCFTFIRTLASTGLGIVFTIITIGLHALFVPSSLATPNRYVYI
jgi:hypothetical protein